MYRPVVFVAVGGCGMDKPTVRPRLTWSGSEPAVAHRKLPGQLADYWHLFRRKIVHHILRIENLSRIRRLIDVVFDKPIHGRNGSRTSDVWHPEQLRCRSIVRPDRGQGCAWCSHLSPYYSTPEQGSHQSQGFARSRLIRRMLPISGTAFPTCCRTNGSLA